MLREPQLSDFIYEEIRQCEKYALLNMITFEAAIRNVEVISILNDLNAMSSEEKLDAILEGDNNFYELTERLREEYFLDYNAYVDYTRNKKGFLDTYTGAKNLDRDYQSIVDEIQAEYKDDTDNNTPSIDEQIELYKKDHAYNVIVNHNRQTSHTHHMSLPLYRPKMHIPQKESVIQIEVPMYHIHPKDIKDYYERLTKKHLKTMEESADYYKAEKLFYDTVDKSKSRANTYAEMFFVWDYMQWWEKTNGTLAPDKTARTVYAEISEMMGIEVNDITGRSAKIEKHLEEMSKLINKCDYKKFYIPRDTTNA